MIASNFLRLAIALAVVSVLAACHGHAHPNEEAHEHTDQAHTSHAHHDHEPHAGPTTRPEEVKPNDGTRKVGDITRCPVSGDVFTIDADTSAIEHEGSTYYLCCDGCVKKFRADPASFVAKAGESASQATTNPADVLPNDGTRKVGEITTCAVSGEVFTISKDSPRAEYNGGTYYFCCGGCVSKFKADPARFTSK